MATPDLPDAVRRRFWPEGAECILTATEVTDALDAQAKRLERRLPETDTVTVMALMSGGMYPAVALTRRLRRPVLLDYVHATRYRGETSGGELEWHHFPDRDRLQGPIVLVDDIFDEGHTMAAVKQRLVEEGAEQVLTCVLTLKSHDRGLARDWVDDHALVVPDRYVFGCGMDYCGLWRQLDSVWAVRE